MNTLVPFFVSVAFMATFAQTIPLGRAPGRLVDVGGRNLHLHCLGSGAPTVIMEAGASSFALDWSLVQREIAKGQRVCSYDRAGSGWSDPRSDVETPSRIVADLRNLLRAAGEQPPFVMAGASAGGLYVRLYQLDHPDEVVGMVLVDPSTENRLFTMFQGQGVPIASLTPDQLLSTLPTTGPLPIARRPVQTGAPFDRLPPELYQRRLMLEQRLIDSFPASVSVDIVRESSQGQHAALARLLASRDAQDNPMRDIPVVVLSRGQDAKSGLAEDHATLARLSGNSRHTIVGDAGHEIHLFAPSVVVQAIQDVSTAVRQGSPLTPRP